MNIFCFVGSNKTAIDMKLVLKSTSPENYELYETSTIKRVNNKTSRLGIAQGRV